MGSHSEGLGEVKVHQLKGKGLKCQVEFQRSQNEDHVSLFSPFPLPSAPKMKTSVSFDFFFSPLRLFPDMVGNEAGNDLRRTRFLLCLKIPLRAF